MGRWRLFNSDYPNRVIALVPLSASHSSAGARVATIQELNLSAKMLRWGAATWVGDLLGSVIYLDGLGWPGVNTAACCTRLQALLYAWSVDRPLLPRLLLLLPLPPLPLLRPAGSG